ncbi:uncharacterized protein LOC142088143 [Calonectris borealis]|uniref:uncharacterized protein LOC142088143 n=1 Tax=Calonectris borealis TaxID=1323832 RepID=UPI003F4B610B
MPINYWRSAPGSEVTILQYLKGRAEDDECLLSGSDSPILQVFLAVKENPVLFLLKVSSCHSLLTWRNASEPCQILSTCSCMDKPAPGASPAPGSHPARRVPSHSEAAAEGSPHPLQCLSLPLLLWHSRKKPGFKRGIQTGSSNVPGGFLSQTGEQLASQSAYFRDPQNMLLHSRSSRERGTNAPEDLGFPSSCTLSGRSCTSFIRVEREIPMLC